MAKKNKYVHVKLCSKTERVKWLSKMFRHPCHSPFSIFFLRLKRWHWESKFCVCKKHVQYAHAMTETSVHFLAWLCRLQDADLWFCLISRYFWFLTSFHKIHVVCPFFSFRDINRNRANVRIQKSSKMNSETGTHTHTYVCKLLTSICSFAVHIDWSIKKHYWTKKNKQRGKGKLKDAPRQDKTWLD